MDNLFNPISSWRIAVDSGAAVLQWQTIRFDPLRHTAVGELCEAIAATLVVGSRAPLQSQLSLFLAKRGSDPDSHRPPSRAECDTAIAAGCIELFEMLVDRSVRQSLLPDQSWLLLKISAPAALITQDAAADVGAPAAGSSCVADDAVVAARGGGAVASVSEVYAGTFVEEARDVLEWYKHAVCPWAGEISSITRGSSYADELITAAKLASTVDLVGYCSGDSLEPCQSMRSAGFVVVMPTAELGLADAASFSGADAPPKHRAAAAAISETASLFPSSPPKGPHKLLIGAAYSGSSEARVLEKLAQLESLAAVLVRRAQDKLLAGEEEEGAQAADPGAATRCASGSQCHSCAGRGGRC